MFGAVSGGQALEVPDERNVKATILSDGLVLARLKLEKARTYCPSIVVFDNGVHKELELPTVFLLTFATGGKSKSCKLRSSDEIDKELIAFFG